MLSRHLLGLFSLQQRQGSYLIVFISLFLRHLAENIAQNPPMISTPRSSHPRRHWTAAWPLLGAAMAAIAKMGSRARPPPIALTMPDRTTDRAIGLRSGPVRKTKPMVSVINPGVTSSAPAAASNIPSTISCAGNCPRLQPLIRPGQRCQALSLENLYANNRGCHHQA